MPFKRYDFASPLLTRPDSSLRYGARMTQPTELSRRAALAAGLAAAATAPALAAEPQRGWPIVELRQYTLHPGGRETLIALFEREFIDTQAAVGAHVLGIFRDLDDPERFVWMRGFSDMAARAKALGDFYGGPVWKAHRNEANATINDSDNVLLLHPTAPVGGLPLAPKTGPRGEILAFIHYFDEALVAPFGAWFEGHIAPRAKAAGAEVLATFATETSANTFPGLPIREKDRVYVWLARLPAGGE